MDSGASLRVMSKSAVTSDESETVRKSKEPTVIMPANGKAKSTEEAAVYVDDLDVFIIMMLLEDSLAVLFLGFLVRNMGSLQ